MDNNDLTQAVHEHVCTEVSKECKTLCSKEVSTLQSPSKRPLLNFSWRTVAKIFETKALVLYSILTAVANPNARNKTNKIPAICTAIGILLKQRDDRMSLISYVISLILKARKLPKQVWVCMC